MSPRLTQRVTVSPSGKVHGAFVMYMYCESSRVAASVQLLSSYSTYYMVHCMCYSVPLSDTLEEVVIGLVVWQLGSCGMALHAAFAFDDASVQ